MISVRMLPALLAGLLPFADAAPKPLQTIKGCAFVRTEWADGDSFRIKTPDGTEHTIRLYGVDCLELHVANDDRNLARLREQRRYFGITDAGKNNEESMKIALALAKEAADLTARNLHAPFTLSTRFSDCGGDPNFKRIYGYITLADGKDLGSLLVQQGWARARGIISTMPDGMSVVEARGMLQDLEIQALKRDRGIWANTNWDKLPAERQLQRKEKAEADIAKDQNGPGPDVKIDPNTATRKQLIDLDGIGEALADRIIAERTKAPFTKPEDLLRVKRLHKPTLEKIRQHLIFPKR